MPKPCPSLSDGVGDAIRESVQQAARDPETKQIISMDATVTDEVPALNLSLEPLFLGDYGAFVHDIIDNKPVFEQYAP